MLILVVVCLCLYVNTWLTFSADRIRKNGIRSVSATDVLCVPVVIVANVTLWRMAIIHCFRRWSGCRSSYPCCCGGGDAIADADSEGFHIG
jgi:hypothetical protein